MAELCQKQVWQVAWCEKVTKLGEAGISGALAVKKGSRAEDSQQIHQE